MHVFLVPFHTQPNPELCDTRRPTIRRSGLLSPVVTLWSHTCVCEWYVGLLHHVAVNKWSCFAKLLSETLAATHVDS